MGLKNDLKKVLFGANALAESAASKVTESGKEAGEKMAKKTDEYLDKAKEKTEEMGADMLDKAGNFWEQAKQKAEQIGGEVLEQSQQFAEKAKGVATKLETEVRNKAEEFKGTSSDTPAATVDDDLAAQIVNAAFDTETETPEVVTTAQNVSEEQSDAFKNLESKMEELADKFKAKFEDIPEEQDTTTAKEPFTESKIDRIRTKLEQTADELTEKLKAKLGDEPQTTPIQVGYDNAKGSLLDGHDDFFEKAKKFADGDYHNTQAETTAPKQSITKDPNYQKPEREGKVYGFEDRDGDGNEIVDDAIILDE